MSDEEKRLASEQEETTKQETDPEETPEETGQVGDQDNQDDGREAREQLYQTKYQDLKEEHKRMLAELESYRSGSQDDDDPTPDDFSKKEQKQAEEYGYDLYTVEGQRAFREQLVREMSGAFTEQLNTIQKSAQAQAAYNAEYQRANEVFSEWITSNSVPKDVATKAVQQLVKEIPELQGRPATLVRYAIDRIQLSAREDGKKSAAETARNAATAKMDALKSVQQPKEGTAVDPQEKDLTQSLVERAKKTNKGRLDGMF